MHILWLDQLECQDVTMTGGKAAILSRLSPLFHVPLGFCVTTTAFADWEQFGALTESVRAEIEIAYRDLATRCGVDNVPVAVRSSAVDEDSRSSSFAGQHLTLLNVSGATAVVQAVAQCFASARSVSALAYREQNRLSSDRLGFAVLVQQLIDADASVVAFSANPVNGQRDEMVINAMLGLGKSVVNGAHTPDTFIISKSNLNVIQRQCADKTYLVAPASNGGVQTKPIPEERRQEPSINESQIRTIARLAIMLEADLGRPVDIECALQATRLYLLQCRPITTLPAQATADTQGTQITHESERHWDEPHDGEATWFGGKELILPLQRSLSLYYYQGWAEAFRSVQAEGCLRARYVKGYEYRLWSYRNTLPPDDVDAAWRELERTLPERWINEWLPEIQADLNRWRTINLSKLAHDSLAGHLHERLTRQLHHWEIHAYMGSVPLGAVERFVNWYLAHVPAATEQDAFQLLQGQRNTSLEADHELWVLSTQLTPAIASALRTDGDLPLPFVADFQAYLNRYGDAAPSFRRRMTTLLLNVAEGHVNDPLAPSAQLAEAREALIAKTRAALTPKDHAEFDDLLAVALANHPLTESHNLWLDQLSDRATKQVIDEFAARLVASHILTQVGDVDYLSVYELIQWGFGLADPLQPRVAERKTQIAQETQQQSPTAARRSLHQSIQRPIRAPAIGGRLDSWHRCIGGTRARGCASGIDARRGLGSATRRSAGVCLD